MSEYGTDSVKTPGSKDDKPARIVLKSGEEYAVAHHFISERETYVAAHDRTREGGIDYRFPMSSIEVIDTRAGVALHVANADLFEGEDGDENEVTA